MSAARVAFVLNPSAGPRGRGRGTLAERVTAAARASELAPTLFLTERRGHARDLAREAAAAGFPVVAAVGGDGTVNEVASGLVGGDAAMAVVPCGSGNGFARDLGISLDLARACRQIAGGRDRPLDVGEVEGRIFLMSVGFGFDAQVTHRFHSDPGGRRGQLPYYAIGLRSVFSYQPRPLTLEVGAVTRRMEPLLLVVANTRQFGGGAVIAPGAEPDDGLLDVVVVPPLGPLRAVSTFAKMFTGTIDLVAGVEVHRAGRARVSGEGPLVAQIDGEPVTWPPSVVLACRPRALRVRGPA